MAFPIKKMRINEIEEIIEVEINSNKISGYDLTTDKILKERPQKVFEAPGKY